MTTAVESSIPRIRERLGASFERVMALPPETVELLLVSILAKGHVLIEGIPGTGKTLLARTLARLLDLPFQRIQFTNDLMPSDVVGGSVWNPTSGELEFREGPLFHSIVLADEINRTSPRTLSCMLEAMEGGLVSVDGETRELPQPFLVLATRNPVEFHGTFPVPEAALDRFQIRVGLHYPNPDAELELYLGQRPEEVLATLDPVLSRDELRLLIDAVPQVVLSPAVASYAYRLVQATREHETVALGASPRAALSWLAAARARALLHGRDHVLPDDLKALALPALAHRMVLRGGGEVGPWLERVLGEVVVEP